MYLVKTWASYSFIHSLIQTIYITLL